MPTRPNSILFLPLFALATLLTLVPIQSTRAAASPNIIFFLSDDHRSDFLSIANHPVVKTPNIDGLAKQGVRFTNMFVTTSICAASRATIFTGLYERTHKYTFGTPPIANAHCDASYPILLRKAGYTTGFIGKFGVAIPRAYRPKMFDYFKPLHRHPYFKKQPDGSKRHITQLAGDHAIQFIDQQKPDKPFQLSVSFNAPHAEDADKKNHYPHPKVVQHLYKDVTIPKPHLSDPAVFNAHPQFLRKSMNRDRYFWRWDTPEKFQKNAKDYFRMISGVDYAIGRVVKHLKQKKLLQNTVIIFTGDNGYYLASRGFAGKWSHFEESLRVPLVIFDPRIPKDKRHRVNKKMVLNLDIAPTILAYANITPPKLHQGRPLKPLVDDAPVKNWRTDFLCEHLMDHPAIPKWVGVRDQRYVYARYFQQNPPYEFLHDLKTDPQQLKNLVADPVYKQTLAKMRLRTNDLRDQHGGPYTRARFPTRRYLQQQKNKKKR